MTAIALSLTAGLILGLILGYVVGVIRTRDVIIRWLNDQAAAQRALEALLAEAEAQAANIDEAAVAPLPYARRLH